MLYLTVQNIYIYMVYDNKISLNTSKSELLNIPRKI